MASIPGKEAVHAEPSIEGKIEAEVTPEAGVLPEVGRPIEQPLKAEDQAPVAPAPAPIALPATPSKDEYMVKVERVLEDNLWTVYAGLTPDLRERFRAKGEETAIKIRGLMDKAKVRGGEVLKIIRDWLKMIPGVSAFFLEQEAKIKTDKIILLAEEHKKEQDGLL